MEPKERLPQSSLGSSVLDCMFIEQSLSLIPAKCPCPKRLTIMAFMHSAFCCTHNCYYASVDRHVNVCMGGNQDGRNITHARVSTPSLSPKLSLRIIIYPECYNPRAFIMQSLLRLLYKHYQTLAHVTHSMLSNRTICTSYRPILSRRFEYSPTPPKGVFSSKSSD